MKFNFTRSFLGFAALAAGCLVSNAEIPSGYTLNPGNNATVDKIETITLSKSNEYYLEVYVNRNILVNGEAIPIKQSNNVAGTLITMVLTEPVTKSGTYNLVIPKGNFTYGYNEIDNPEISWTVIVDNPDQPDVPDDVAYTLSPASGSTVPSVNSFTIDFTGASAVSVNPDVEGAKVSFKGTVQDTELSYGAGATASQIVVTLTPGIEVSGNCTITLPAGLFSVTLDGNVLESPEIKTSYILDAPLGPGEKFVVNNIKYLILSNDPPQLAVTWPDNESSYSRLTTIPTAVSYQGIDYAVTEIGRLAFSDVPGMTNFIVPDGITKIDYGAFWDSTLQTIQIPSTVVEIGESAFDTCESLTAIEFPSSVTTFGSDVLYGCVSLKSVKLPENMERIPDYFMQGCQAVTSIDLPSSVKEIGEFAFAECTGLSDVVLPENIISLERFAFSYCLALTKLDVPESVVNIGHGVFYQSGLTEASLPDNFTVIPDGMYQCCTELPSFVIGDKVEEIENEAFYWCFGLKEITFGKNVALIGEKVFYGDEKIQTVTCLNPVPAEGAEFEDAVYNNARLIVPDGSLDAYKAADGWKNFISIYETSGIEGVVDTDLQAPRYYNLQGVEVESPEGGIFIKKVGDKTTKVVK